MVSEQLNTRLPDRLYRRFEQFRKSRNLSKAEASRRLITGGLIDSQGELREEPASDSLVVESGGGSSERDEIRTLADFLEAAAVDPDGVTD